MNWNKFPFVRLLLPFLAGIIIAIKIQLPIIGLNYFLLAICFLIIFSKNLNNFSIGFFTNWVSGTLITIALFIAGYQVTILNTEKFKPQHFVNQKQTFKPILFKAKITDFPIEKSKTFKAIAEITSIKIYEKWRPCEGKIILFIQKDSLIKQLLPSSIIIVKASINRISTPRNPGEFDYQQYMDYQNIYNQCEDFVHKL